MPSDSELIDFAELIILN